jgi:hypothetical protein
MVQDFDGVTVEDSNNGAGDLGGASRDCPSSTALQSATLHITIVVTPPPRPLMATSSSWGPDIPLSGHRAFRQT